MDKKTVKLLKLFYHFCKKNIEIIIIALLKKNNIRVAHLISIFTRWFFLREFKKKEPNFRNVEELQKLVSKAIIKENKKSVREQKMSDIPEGLKILFVCNMRPTNFKASFSETAAYNGLTVDNFFADKISYLPSNMDNYKVLQRETSELLAKIKKMQPNLIIFDINYIGNKNTLNNKFIKKIKMSNNCKIVGFMGDFYSKEAINVAKYWAKSMDTIWHGEPGSSNIQIPKMHYVPFFVNEKSFYPEKHKLTDFFFSGTGNISRYVYITSLLLLSKKHNYNGLINLHNHDHRSLTYQEYCQKTRQSRIIVNFTARSSPYVRVFTGRSMEAIASCSLLIEEKNNSISKLFTPYAHYIPFDSKKELAIALKFSNTYTSLANKVAEMGNQNYYQTYHSKFFWSRILKLCLNKS